jgi:hypothetical protein
VLLYRFVPTVADAVRASVKKQLLEGMDGFERYSVVAHSLGTSVLHDSLVWMFDPASPKPLDPEKFRFQAVAMVANVSRVLQSDENGARWEAYRSVVQPNAKVTRGVCRYFLNAWHTWDPVPVPKKFKPMPDWPDKATRELKGAFQDIETEGLEAGGSLKDVHDLGHYLRNPEFHIALFRSLIPLKGLISEKEETDALDKHRADNPLSKVKQKLEALKQLRLGDEEGDWAEILSMLHKLLD